MQDKSRDLVYLVEHLVARTIKQLTHHIRALRAPLIHLFQQDLGRGPGTALGVGSIYIYFTCVTRQPLKGKAIGKWKWRTGEDLQNIKILS